MNLSRTLSEVLPKCFLSGTYDKTIAFNLRDMKVVQEHSLFYEQDEYSPWPGKHKNVYFWVELENGLAVGWNENPENGWSFPVLNLCHYAII